MSLWALVARIGHGLVTRGLGGGSGVDAPTNEPARIYVREPVSLFTISVDSPIPLYVVLVSEPVPLFSIGVVDTMSKIYVGAVATFVRVEFRNKHGVLVDPTGIVVTVYPPSGDEFEIEYLVSPTDGVGDALIRDAEGKYSVQIDATAERGDGTYRYVIVSEGAKAVTDGTFEVYSTII